MAESQNNKQRFDKNYPIDGRHLASLLHQLTGLPVQRLEQLIELNWPDLRIPDTMEAFGLLCTLFDFLSLKQVVPSGRKMAVYRIQLPALAKEEQPGEKWLVLDTDLKFSVSFGERFREIEAYAVWEVVDSKPQNRILNFEVQTSITDESGEVIASRSHGDWMLQDTRDVLVYSYQMSGLDRYFDLDDRGSLDLTVTTLHKPVSVQLRYPIIMTKQTGKCSSELERQLMKDTEPLDVAQYSEFLRWRIEDTKRFLNTLKVSWQMDDSDPDQISMKIARRINFLPIRNVVFYDRARRSQISRSMSPTTDYGYIGILNALEANRIRYEPPEDFLPKLKSYRR